MLGLFLRFKFLSLWSLLAPLVLLIAVLQISAFFFRLVPWYFRL